jgi:1-acyl-sn-glycerol-3-phosphate acyltransferase
MLTRSDGNNKAEYTRRAYRFWYVILNAVFSLFYGRRVIHKERIPEGPLLVCANHSTAFDPLFICFSFGRDRYVRFMAKIEVMKAPVLGAFLKAIGVFGVVRGKSDIGAIKTAMRILREGGIVGIFPEGHRHKTDGGEAKTGAVMLAVKTGAKLLPVYIPRNKILFSRVPIVIGEPYSIAKPEAGREDYEKYADELMSKILALKSEVS